MSLDGSVLWHFWNKTGATEWFPIWTTAWLSASIVHDTLQFSQGIADAHRPHGSKEMFSQTLHNHFELLLKACAVNRGAGRML
jgi:hypothetical protein